MVWCVTGRGPDHLTGLGLGQLLDAALAWDQVAHLNKHSECWLVMTIFPLLSVLILATVNKPRVTQITGDNKLTLLGEGEGEGRGGGGGGEGEEEGKGQGRVGGWGGEGVQWRMKAVCSLPRPCI